MKALSLWQPWALAIAVGAKRIETRSWKTHYRGLLLIHAAKRFRKPEMELVIRLPHFQAVLGMAHQQSLTFGTIIASCWLTDCIPTERAHSFFDLDDRRYPLYGGNDYCTERQLGDYTPGRWAWILTGIRPLSIPTPKAGARGLFDAGDVRGVCRLCGCTDLSSCPGGCHWTDQSATLCSACDRPQTTDH